MESALNVGSQNSNLVTAQALREMTISPQDLFEKQKAGVLDSLMSSMVKLATESGKSSYTANLNPSFDPGLLSSVVKELKDLGYEVASEAKSDSKLGAFISLSVNW